MERIPGLSSDIVICDINMPVLNGLATIEHLREAGYNTPVVMLSMHAEEGLVIAAFKFGASAYVLMTSAAEELIAAMHIALAGGRLVSPRDRAHFTS